MADEPAPTPHPAMEDPACWSQLTNVIAMRSSQDSVGWSIFGTFWTTNAVLLVALFATGFPPASIGKIISGLGLLLSVIWLAIQRRAIGNMSRYDTLIERLEIRLRVEPSLAISPALNPPEDRLPAGPGRQLMLWSGVGAILGWAAALLIFTVVGMTPIRV